MLLDGAGASEEVGGAVEEEGGGLCRDEVVVGVAPVPAEATASGGVYCCVA